MSGPGVSPDPSRLTCSHAGLALNTTHPIYYLLLSVLLLHPAITPVITHLISSDQGTVLDNSRV